MAVILNDNGQLVVEPLRVKKERIDDEDGNAVEVVSSSCLSRFLGFCKTSFL